MQDFNLMRKNINKEEKKSIMNYFEEATLKSIKTIRNVCLFYLKNIILNKNN